MIAKELLGAVGNAAESNYIEDVFSTYLYTGNGSTQTITNDIDLAGKGGLVWIKDRNSGAKGHALFDTARGVNKKLQSQSTGAEFSSPNQLTAFNATGFDLGSAGDPNGSGTTYASGTFRKQPKFFDVVTYTGNGTDNRTVVHNLGSTPGCFIVKRTDTSGTEWLVYHRGVGATAVMVLNNTDNAYTSSGYFNNTAPTSTVFTVANHSGLNASGGTYVAYLFAHNAGGFGLTGTDNVVSCGSFTSDGVSTSAIDLGWEPQWVLLKRVSGNGNWNIADNMRGFSQSGVSLLYPNLSNAEDVVNGAPYWTPTATGFSTSGYFSSGTYIYIAIRKGPMKVPTDATKVYATSTSDTVNNPEYISNFPVDMALSTNTLYGGNRVASSRLLAGTYLFTNTTAAEATGTQYAFDFSNGWARNAVHDSAYRSWMFRRAPGFFDEVCYTGTGSATTVAHNLGVAPELMIVKSRSLAGQEWPVQALGDGTKILKLNSTSAFITNSAYWNNTGATANVFTVTGSGLTGSSGATYVAYLFATCPGVSKVTNFTGNGSSQTINCGFTSGARFVMIKATSTTGDWFIFDTARGIVSGNDPHLSLNTTAAEVTSDDTIDPDSTGFIVNQVAATNCNVNGVSYIMLAIA
jgi:hypothetical protein